MEITVLGAAGGDAPGGSLTGFLIGDDLLLDAGTAGSQLSPAAQQRIRHVLLTHSHLDHIRALPLLLDNVINRIADSVTVYGSEQTLAVLRRHIFNGLVWPDFTLLPSPAEPVLRLQPVASGMSFPAGSHSITAIAVQHSVPTLAYVISGQAGSVLFSGDTAPVEALWQRAASLPDLRAVFLECTFPSDQQERASRTRHLTPADVRQALARMDKPAENLAVYLYHIKPEFLEDISREAAGLAPWKVRALRGGERLAI